MGSHLIGSRRHDLLVVALALFVVGCRSSSHGAPATDGEGDEDGGGIDMVGGGDDEADATVEADSAIDSGSTALDAIDGDGTDLDGPDGGPATDPELCTAACMVTAAVTACPSPFATCKVRCDRQVALGLCLPALRALLQCQASVGPEGYECLSGMRIILKAGLCAAEEKTSVDCRSGDAGSD